jgi:hypothetical protein
MKIKLYYGNGLSTVRQVPGANNANNREDALVQLGQGYLRIPCNVPPLYVNLDMVTHMEFYDNSELP